MARRSGIKKETKESMALKKMRKATGLAQRKAALKIGVNQSMVNHCENGRAEISEDYLEKFLEGLNFSREDFEKYREGQESELDLRSKCKEMIDNLDQEKINILYNLLVNF